MAQLLKPTILRYIITVILVTAMVLLARLVITWAAEIFLHPIPIAGGWIKSLELIELSVIVLFALLGFGLGAAAMHLPAKTSLGWKALALVVIFPLVFFSSYWLRYQLWLNQVTAQSDLPRQQVVETANVALERESGSGGFWGYYRTTVRMPLLPATGEELQRMTEDQRWFRAELTRFSGIEPGVFSMIFDGAGWGIRAFYLLLAVGTSLIYFLKGVAWADTQHLRRLTKIKPQVSP
ncbi:hypothetical protein GFS31_17940 [Leptolyngbya sp. BL0902]|uniref:hypothetical protein n=1 Tax=Leptolyngbya sp. BL0902 TaxID=1115757 RepID=UPI0018E7C73B|nr:hypothetical protein [Leptolyngbya sp. BL0902]QQE65109.1 hypothetical protein GFS31_17940 [Leptolyngbya sp. BL0902]